MRYDRAARAGSARTAPVPPSEHVIKILISTDNHLGYLEKDPVRGDDSFRVFEEVLELAKSNQVDMLLLAGDLFHDNKPSRNTLVRTMRLLRRHCLSPEGEVHLAVRSDPTAVNYMDPCVAVSLPVFVIHGNHDDPTGGAGHDALSALDLLAHAGLVTYFGRVYSAKKVEVAPILLQKGRTALALYGLGNVRDEILYDTWARQKRVKWLSPEQPSGDNAYAYSDEEGDADDASAHKLRWFNLFVLHQNRVTRGSSQGIAETLLPPWLDYVVWGHEHDSIPDLTLAKPPIVQPGSTVATSLSLGESKPKHAILLEVFKGKLKHRPVPLHTVRNFQFEDIALSNQQGLSETDAEALRVFLESTVNEMVEKQETAFDNKVSNFQSGTSKELVNGVRYPPRSFYIKKLTPSVRQPLIRLRVETTGNWETPSPQRFGQGYVGRVACAADVLHFYRSKRRLKTSRTFLQGEALHGVDEDGLDDGEGGMTFSQTGAEEQEVVHIPKLVQYFLYHKQAGGTGLKFLELDRLSGAVDLFVNKLENKAIPDYVTAYLKVQQDKTLKEAAAGGSGLDEGQLLEKFKNEATAAANRILAASQAHSSSQRDQPGVDNGQKSCPSKDEEVVKPKTEEVDESDIQARLDDIHAVVSNHPKIAAAAAANKVAQESLARANQDVSSEDDVDVEPVTPARKGRASTRGRGRGRGRSTAGGSGLRQTTLGRKPPARSSNPRKSTRKASAPVIEDSEDEVEPVRGAKADDIVNVDSEEEYVPMPTSRKRRARNSASEGRISRQRIESTPASQRRSAFATRAKVRRNTATINLDEESGDDAM